MSDANNLQSMSVNLGPVSPTLAEDDVKVIGSGTGADYNPRCLKRDVSVWVSSRWSQDQNSTDLITENTNIADFQTTMQGDFASGFYGVHTAGHFTIGGDPGGVNLPFSEYLNAADQGRTFSHLQGTLHFSCTTDRSTELGGSGKTKIFQIDRMLSQGM